MSFLDDLLRTLRAPLDFVRGKTSRVRSLEGGIQGNINRIKNLPREFKGELDYNKQLVKDYGNRARNAKDRAANWQHGTPQGNGAAGSQHAGNAAVAPSKKKRAGMGLFSKKKRCPSCNEKLDAKWELCPYCGFGAPEGGEPQSGHPRTMALDIGGGGNQGGGQGGHPRTMALDASNTGGGHQGGKPRTMALDAAGAAPPQQARSGSGGSSARLVAWIIPLDGPQGGQLLELRSRAIVGTAPDADVVVTDPSVSGRHAEFTVQGSIFRVSDLGSTNGTFVNEKRIQSAELIDNDVLRLGRTSFKFKST